MSSLRIGLRLALILAATTLSTLQVSPAASAEAPRHVRLDPYKNFRFRVLFEGRCVAGFQSAEFRGPGGMAPLKSTGVHKYPTITLKRGLTKDTGFWNWARSVEGYGHSGAPAAARRDLRIALLDETGRPAGFYAVRRAWVSEVNALPDLDAGANAIAIEHVKLENEGWERNSTATETPPC
jgi:phage tail-like protein